MWAVVRTSKQEVYTHHNEIGYKLSALPRPLISALSSSFLFSSLCSLSSSDAFAIGLLEQL